jgi:hypothetical protein
MSERCNVLTIATGKPLYLELAVNLARSFYYWNKDENIAFYLATDNQAVLPPDVLPYVNLILFEAGTFGTSFSTKLYLDQIAPQGRTLFIDSDCLIYGRLNRVFDVFQGHSVSVIGSYVSSGEWFGNIALICKKMGVDRIPKFNGGIYYIEKGEKAAQIYSKARELEAQYDDIGFVRLRGKPNDEVLMAVSMALNGQAPVIDDGTIMSDPQACRGKYEVNVISGKTSLVNKPYPHKLHQSWYPFHRVHPVVVHFLGYYTAHYPYKLDAYRLKKVAGNGLTFWNRLWGRIHIEFTERFIIYLKKIIRPAFHLLFGARTVKPSDRI